MPPDCLILDASCAINLYATGRLREIVAALDYQLFVVDYVLEREILYIRVPDATGAGEETTPINLSPMIDDGLIQVIRFEHPNEQETYVGLASLVDDGEAMSGALALHRGCSVATDDRKARRVFAERIPSVSLVSTLELLSAWSVSASLPDAELRDAMLRLRSRASYVPARLDPLGDWWREIVTAEP